MEEIEAESKGLTAHYFFSFGCELDTAQPSMPCVFPMVNSKVLM